MRSPLLSWSSLTESSSTAAYLMKHVAARLRGQPSVSHARPRGNRGCGHEQDERGDRAALARKRVKSAQRREGSKSAPRFALAALFRRLGGPETQFPGLGSTLSVALKSLTVGRRRGVIRHPAGVPVRLAKRNVSMHCRNCAGASPPHRCLAYRCSP
ncbi:hypothetical protein MTO96_012008 [Rhipicephalus appendiculatus]